MKKTVIEGIEVERSCGNVFADVAQSDARKLKIKAAIAAGISRAVHRLGRTCDIQFRVRLAGRPLGQLVLAVD